MFFSSTPVHTAWPTSKICPPHPRTLIPRAHLFAAVTRAVNAGHVTLIVAPGGSGKTCLLAAWAQQALLPVAWYSLDAADRDPRRLVEGLCAAIERATPGLTAGATAALHSGSSPTAAVGMLLGTLETRPLVLVLDDFHHLDDVPDGIALWDHLLRFRPPALGLIILSRSVPVLGFAALAAFDELTALGRVELRFDPAETAGLLAAHGLETAGAAALAARSGGWASGVLLLARAATGGPAVLRDREETVMRHLGAEILESLPTTLRRFLVESAPLGPLSTQDADAILGRRDSAALFAEAAARGLFVDQEDQFYRYHDLFAEYLVGVLKDEDATRLREIRQAAATWWSGQGDLPRALSLLAVDENWAPLAAMLDQHRGVLWARGLWGTVLVHLDHLPVAYHTPRLLVLCGHAHAQRGEHAQALALAQEGMRTANGEEEWLGLTLLHTQALVQAGRYAEGATAADAALAVARRVDYEGAVVLLREMRGAAWLRLGRLDDGCADLLAALAAHVAAHDADGEARTLFNLASQLVGAGRVAGAAEHLMRAGEIWQRAQNSAALGNTYNSWALLHALTGDFDAARVAATRAVDLAREISYPLLESAALATLAEVCADAGLAAAAESHGQAAADLAARLDLVDVLNDAGRARLAAALLRRDRSGARHLLDEARVHAVTAIDAALLAYAEGVLALRARADSRAATLLLAAAQRLEQLDQPHRAARAYLLAGDALLTTSAIRRAEQALNSMAGLALSAGCAGYLAPAARFARHALAGRRVLRHLRRDTRQVLDHLAVATGHGSASLPAREGEDARSASLWLSPFGQGHLRVGDQDIPMAALPIKARELLFFAVQAGRPLSREEILTVLWDDAPEAMQALWDASRHLRRVLGQGSWGPRNGAYAVHAPVTNEEVAFTAAVAVVTGAGPVTERLAAAEQALRAVGGGGYLEWCDSLWVTVRRAQVVRDASTVALDAAQLYSEQGRHHEAIMMCQRAIALDVLAEEPRGALLQCLVAAGDRQGARRAYLSYQQLVREELDEELPAHLTTLVEAIAVEPARLF